jgi:hypothetical protein
MRWHGSAEGAVIPGSAWRSLTGTPFGGVSWRCQLAVSVGGVSWRCQLAESVGGLACRSDLAVRLGGVPWPDVDPLRIDQCAPMGWHRSNARAVIRGSTWRSLTSTQFGGVSWRSGLAEWLGGTSRACFSANRCSAIDSTRGVRATRNWQLAFVALCFAERRRIAPEPLPRNPANSIGCRCPPSPRDFTPRASVHSPLPGRGLGSSRSPRRQSNCAARDLPIAFSILLPGATSPP